MRVSDSAQASAACSRSVKKGGLAPGGEAVEALLLLAVGAGFQRVQAEAVGAAVDLRDAELDEGF